MQFKVAYRAEGEGGAYYCFGWAGTGAMTDEQIEQFSVNLMLSSQDGEPVEVLNLGKICEIMALTAEKQEALGIDLGKSGLWLGVRVRDKQTWKSLMSNQVFELSVAAYVQNKPAVAGETRKDMELKQVADNGIVELCKRAAETGNYANLSKARIEGALNEMAEAEAQRRDVSVEQGYALVLKRDDGATLYRALDYLRPGTAA